MVMQPVWDGYFADPFVLRTDGGYYAYGTSPESPDGSAVFQVLHSTDLTAWRSLGASLAKLPAAIGTDYWAPEVAVTDDGYWMYYSVGHGDRGHHLRVAHASRSEGPFTDQGLNLTPEEPFAIDPHPFRDADGTWYLFYAHDVLEHERPGTHLAVDRLDGMTRLTGRPTPILAPNADWQIYERDRAKYGRRFTWHTLEGPTVITHRDTYVMTYSGGSWRGPNYLVSFATAPHPLGPWTHAPSESGQVLASSDQLRGPGHNSIVTDPSGRVHIAFHAWDAVYRRRQFYLEPLTIDQVDGQVSMRVMGIG